MEAVYLSMRMAVTTPVPHYLLALFYLVEIRHRHLLQSQSRTRLQRRCPEKYYANTAIAR